MLTVRFLCNFCVDTRVGLNKGYPTTPLEKRAKPSHRKGTQTQRTNFVRSVVREVAGFAPYERRVMELLRNSKVRPYRCYQSLLVFKFCYFLQDKKARKLTKKRVRPQDFALCILRRSHVIAIVGHASALEAQARGARQRHPGEPQGRTLNDDEPFSLVWATGPPLRLHDFSPCIFCTYAIRFRCPCNHRSTERGARVYCKRSAACVGYLGYINRWHAWKGLPG